jgi:hypothetical protein
MNKSPRYRKFRLLKPENLTSVIAFPQFASASAFAVQGVANHKFVGLPQDPAAADIEFCRRIPLGTHGSTHGTVPVPTGRIRVPPPAY